MKYFLAIISCTVLVYANVELVPISITTINWKESIVSQNVKLIKPNDEYNCKKYLDIEVLKQNQYRAKHYILKNKAICDEDVYIQSDKKIKFNFGFLEIEKDGELIKETNEYIKIKNLDGTIIKIYKNGSEK